QLAKHPGVFVVSVKEVFDGYAILPDIAAHLRASMQDLAGVRGVLLVQRDFMPGEAIRRVKTTDGVWFYRGSNTLNLRRRGLFVSNPSSSYLSDGEVEALTDLTPAL